MPKIGMDAPYQFLSAASASDFGLQFPPPILVLSFSTLFILTACRMAPAASGGCDPCGGTAPRDTARRTLTCWLHVRVRKLSRTGNLM